MLKNLRIVDKFIEEEDWCDCFEVFCLKGEEVEWVILELYVLGEVYVWISFYNFYNIFCFYACKVCVVS